MDSIDDLTLAVIAQNNLLLALIRTHPNRDVLATAFKQAQEQFPEASQLSAASPRLFKLTSTTIAAFEKAFVTQLDPLSDDVGR
ncbi:hypothetical protein LVB77_03470 [Lysobacter sp. 5GHs7-4]|uniref:hypothetical protein n=1 Tax=Lysobacter sp. 5GHs7-4 TaxID=2904253 RepID=UPI001E5F2FAD|nr:hypothetical protein [Lysobacter sp. 5GHs7-4]UHQ23784.1 hypothetical protein LVB77_03470 [Lysobacter sp. 5GHs7-4]